MKKMLLTFASIFCFIALLMINFRMNENSKITTGNSDSTSILLEDMETVPAR